VKPNKTIYTIGHSNHAPEYFIDLLKKHNVECVVDVRSTPYSKYVPWTIKKNIEKLLNKNNVNYKYLGDKLGGSVINESTAMQNGLPDYEKIVKTNMFLDGIENLLKISQNQNISIMCSEKDPINCHRFVLIARNLQKKKNVIVKHIYADGLIKSNNEVENILLKKYKSQTAQQDLFENRINIYDKVYRLRNVDLFKKK
jgi:uncharacterized protein (DUF488 family)